MVATDSNVLVLYRVVNSKTDSRSPHYNAFYMPRDDSGGVSLASVKQHCRAPGSAAYHWRVRVDESQSNNKYHQSSPQFTWWDVQDKNAALPIASHTQSELEHLFSDVASVASTVNTADANGDGSVPAPSASGAVRSLGKFAKKLDAATSGAVQGRHGQNSAGPRINVIAFKVLDLARTEDACIERRQSSSAARARRLKRSGSTSSDGNRSRQPPSPPYTPPQTPPRSPYGGYTSPHTPPKTSPRSIAVVNPARRATPKQQGGRDLLDFGSVGGSSGCAGHQTASTPAATSNETRAERLKREYEAKRQKQNRVWDDVDQRWVEVDAKAGSTVHRGSTSAPPGVAAKPHSATAAKKAVIGIKLDGSNAQGKSANVQAAVNKRVNDMKQSQAKALQEVRDREAKKKQNEAEEDVVRTNLGPQIKAWSEEHGKKKQLRALLSSLHTVLWEGAKWKPVSLGDILDASKCKRCYHRATLVVHPDKTGNLNAEQRFLAKRIFDALSQAKTEFDALN
mmetsp:Transcript_20258/g.43709  ORF Transcript_20258/g.43709 Transcript_20258/m.43709 type:complete len:510 (-) Transcript_20258:727-2256(-)